VRPIELEVRGFTCFKTSARVDFRGLDLFAITGPTGAGKTSLLEAMVYALYGRSPRVSNEIRHLLALGAEKALVDYTFSAGKQTYRVVRTFSRKGNTEARLEEKREDKFASLAAGSREVSSQVEKILGLDYEAFVRTVMLPQGRFDEFLKGQAADRQRILASLLDLGIYEKMRKRAGEQLSVAEARLKDLESRLGELSAATEEALQGAKETQSASEKDSQRVADERQQTERDAQEAKEVAEIARGIERARANLAKLRAQAPQLDEKRTRLRRAQRAAPLLPLWRALGQAAERAHKGATEASRRADLAAQALARSAAAKAAASAASHAALAIPSLDLEISRLREAITTNQLYQSQRDELARVTHRAKTAQDALAKAQHGFARFTRDADTARREVDKLLKDQARLRPTEEAARALSQAQHAEAEYLRAKLAFTQARSAKKSAQESAQRALAESHAASNEHENTEALYRAAQEALQHAQNALDEARREDMASSLRRHLAPNDRCPVCTNVVKRIPVGAAPHIEHAEEDLKAAQQRARSADQRREKARAQAAQAQALAAGAEARAQAASAALDEAKAQGEERAKGRDTALLALRSALTPAAQDDAALRTVLQSLESAEPKRELKETLDSLAHTLGEREGQAAALESALKDAQSRIRKADEEAARLEGRLSRAQEELAHVTADEARLSSQVEALAEKLVGIDGDPNSLLATVQERRDALRRAKDEADAALSLAEARAKDAATQSDEARASAEHAEQERAEQEREFLPRLAAAGFDDEAALSQAALPEDQMHSLSAELAAHDQQSAALAAEEQRLVEALAGRVADPVRAEALAQQAQELQRQERKIASELGALSQKIRNLEEAIARKRKLQEEESGLRREQERAGRLAHNLRGDEFQSFVLDEAFRFLAEDGSRQLHRLSSERYTFDVRDREFYVLDHWNAAEARTVRTLSGGETFLASLALSVALAERIHDLSTTTTGDRMLESLFLDEGFGTLDPDSLDIVVSALEELRTTGRMVGVISHVQELTARLPARVVIEKMAGGSVISQEGGG
jgi:exonuclease SbcC